MAGKRWAEVEQEREANRVQGEGTKARMSKRREWKKIKRSSRKNLDAAAEHSSICDIAVRLLRKAPLVLKKKSPSSPKSQKILGLHL